MPAVADPYLTKAARPIKQNYFQACRHPWPCLWFLLPLLAVYEAGILAFGGVDAEWLRNGADCWLRFCLISLGFRQLYWVPLLVLLTLAVWSWFRRHDRPNGLVDLCTGMALESILCALALWSFGRAVGPYLSQLGVMLQMDSRAGQTDALAQLITYIGAGIYEEWLFRIVLFWGLFALWSLSGLPRPAGLLVAALASSAAFAGVHHLGAHGEPFRVPAFLFRMLAGLYFTVLMLFRGFGIAVGTHAFYDILAGLALD
ncbi:MAG: CAAX amino protease [Gemmatales bacterium]|nr:MAG: CAAX amino protease [Gemmatales bacterium]